MSQSTVVLITGANRGLGLGLVKQYASRSATTVIAACRNPAKMPEINVGEGSRIFTVALDAADGQAAQRAVDELGARHAISTIDVVIANAGLMTDDAFSRPRDYNLESFEQMWRVNVLGPLALFKATAPLLQAGSKFIIMSSTASMPEKAYIEKTGLGYGISKTADNYLARYIHFNEPDLTVFSLHPGWVETDTGSFAHTSTGGSGGLISIEDSCAGMTKVIDEATRERSSGRFLKYDGTDVVTYQT